MAPLSEAEPVLKVLIAEDEPAIARGLADVFRFRGFDVHLVEDGAVALRRGLEEHWHLIVLDVMLPEVNGFSVCEQLRAAGRRMPVLMLTAKSSEDDIVRGFEAGADDYVTKPFGVRELMARTQALVRRNQRNRGECFEAGPLRVSPDKAEAQVGNTRWELTRREIRILRSLAEDPGRIVSRLRLLREAWDMTNAEQLETRTVDVHIAKLRKKLGRYGAVIETVRGQGYRLCP